MRVYGAIKQDPQFIQQLIEIYHEMTTAKMSFWILKVYLTLINVLIYLIFEKVAAHFQIQGQIYKGVNYHI